MGVQVSLNHRTAFGLEDSYIPVDRLTVILEGPVHHLVPLVVEGEPEITADSGIVDIPIEAQGPGCGHVEYVIHSVIVDFDPMPAGVIGHQSVEGKNGLLVSIVAVAIADHLDFFFADLHPLVRRQDVC